MGWGRSPRQPGPPLGLTCLSLRLRQLLLRGRDGFCSFAGHFWRKGEANRPGLAGAPDRPRGAHRAPVTRSSRSHPPVPCPPPGTDRSAKTAQPPGRYRTPQAQRAPGTARHGPTPGPPTGLPPRPAAALASPGGRDRDLGRLSCPPTPHPGASGPFAVRGAVPAGPPGPARRDHGPSGGLGRVASVALPPGPAAARERQAAPAAAPGPRGSGWRRMAATGLTVRGVGPKMAAERDRDPGSATSGKTSTSGAGAAARRPPRPSGRAPPFRAPSGGRGAGAAPGPPPRGR